MLVDARQVRSRVIRTAVAIVGAGAAGIAIARELDAAGIETILLESGGLEFDASTQQLYAGRSAGRFADEEQRSTYLTASRLRYFGGSTNHWYGFCRPLDPIDFEARDWVPASGWPIDAAELRPYYQRAARLVRIHAFDGDELSREPAARRPLPALEGSDAFTTDVFYYPSPPTNFGVAYRDEIVGSRRVTLLIHANAVELETDAAARTLERVRVRTLAGNELSVEAGQFVLATGGIENARLLLASNRVTPDGVGNAHDLVGRYFMEHPHVPIGAYALWCERPEALALYESYTPNVELGHMSHGVIASTAAYQRREKTLNFSLQLQRPEAVEAGADALLEGARRLDRVLRHDSGGDVDTLHRVTGLLHARTEQTPNADSRVTLDRERDALGLPRARLDWRLVELDHTSLYRSAIDFARAIYLAHGGRIRIDLDPAAFETTAIGFGFHHMGTTRMARRPTEGVVDEHCRVHDLDNLYVAGSSVFPTSGYANPTLTLLALALRLADRLRAAGSGS